MHVVQHEEEVHVTYCMQRCVCSAKHRPSEPTSLHVLLAAYERKLEITDMWGENINADGFIEVRNGNKGF